MRVPARFRRLIPPATILAIVVLVAFAAPVLPLADPVRQDVAHRLTGTTWTHWLGQDEYGRDVLSRLVWGGRISLAVAALSALLAGLVGTVLGLVGGFFRGFIELPTVRAAEIVLCFPPMLLALLVVTLLGPGAVTLIMVLAILYAPGFSRVAYAETLSVRALDFVTAQEALGARTGRILLRTILPNIAPPLIVQFSLTVAAALVLESGLSFLGLGVVPPAPSLGLMIRGARSAMEQAPLLMLWPCLALAGTVFLLNVVCDRLRDALDPRAAQAGGAHSLLSRLTAMPPSKTAISPEPGTLISIEGLTIDLDTQDGPVRILRDVSFKLTEGETVAVVGESGSGKTVTALAMLGLLPGALRPVAGRVVFTGRDGRACDLLALSQPALRELRGDQIAMVFQDPSSSLNPLHTIGSQVAESIVSHGEVARADVAERVVSLLRQVGVPDPERRAAAYPHELSGGQRQRVMIAAAIANAPRLLIADEPTTALDVTVQAQILELLAAFKTRTDGSRTAGMGMIFVTHNLAVVAEIADSIVVMYAGEVIETGNVDAVFANPHHPYTAALMASAPEAEAPRLLAIPGQVPSPYARPPGCSFAPRCTLALPACDAGPIALAPTEAGRQARCIRWTELASA